MDKRFEVYRFLPQASRLALIGLLDERALKNIYPEAVRGGPTAPYLVDESQKTIAFEQGHIGLEPWAGQNPINYEVFVVEVDGNVQWTQNFETCVEYIKNEYDFSANTAVEIKLRRAKFAEILEILDTMM